MLLLSPAPKQQSLVGSLGALAGQRLSLSCIVAPEELCGRDLAGVGPCKQGFSSFDIIVQIDANFIADWTDLA